ncbi:hypothetical protein HGA64_01450 [Candidatus Falkowbacteria bacterium]|nr:hypothetical protein [Candidatus Falkowbacteria bacterium]
MYIKNVGILQLNDKFIRSVIFVFGALLCIVDAFFLITGIDEIWQNGVFWFLGAGVMGLIASIGIASILISLSKEKRAPRAFLFSSLAFLMVIVVAFFTS